MNVTCIFLSVVSSSRLCFVDSVLPVGGLPLTSLLYVRAAGGCPSLLLLVGGGPPGGRHGACAWNAGGW